VTPVVNFRRRLGCRAAGEREAPEGRRTACSKPAWS